MILIGSDHPMISDPAVITVTVTVNQKLSHYSRKGACEVFVLISVFYSKHLAKRSLAAKSQSHVTVSACFRLAAALPARPA
jgi:hypothetical protein